MTEPITFEERAAALQCYLTYAGRNCTSIRLTESYAPKVIEVNKSWSKHGSPPEDVQATANQLRKDLARIFGDEATKDWTTDFLQSQEIKYEKLAPYVKERCLAANTAYDRLPLITCDCPCPSWIGLGKIRLCRGMLDPLKREFTVKVPSGIGGRGPVRSRTYYVAGGGFTAEQRAKFGVLLDQEQALSKKWEEANTELKELRAYRNLEPVIKASFNWPTHHDNDMARAYQAIVNPLYLIGSPHKENDGEYQKQLRLAFDGHTLVDHREEHETCDAEFLVLHESELGQALAERIKEDIWAFNASFLAKFMPLPEEHIRNMQEAMSEDANEPLTKLIGDKLDVFVNEAISADGPGRFLSQYDGEMITFGDWRIFAQDINWGE